MALPSPTETTSRGGMAYRAETAATAPAFNHALEKAWLWHANPRQAEVVIITPEYAAVLGVDPGAYVVPELTAIVATPGANGVRGEANWTMEQLISTDPGGGFHEVAKDLALQGTPLLNPMEDIPAKLLPAGVGPGGYLRATTCRSGTLVGRCHHSAWQWLEHGGHGEDAHLRIDHPSFHAWHLWLVLSGKILPANEAAVDRRRTALRSRLARATRAGLTDAQLAQVQAPRQKQIAETEGATRATTDTPKAKKAARKASE